MKLVELLLALSILLSVLLAEHGNVLCEDLLDLELLHLVAKCNFFLLDNTLLGVNVVDEVVLILHLHLFALDLVMESLDLLLARNSAQVVSEALDFIFQLAALLLHLEDVSSELVDSSIGVESILEEGWGSHLLVGILVHEVV